MNTIEKISELMKKNGITNAVLANAIGKDKSVFTQWKKGLQKPSVESIIKIADYFSVTTDYLLCVSDNPNSNNLSNITVSLIEKYRQLNIKGQEKATIYIDDLLSSAKYKIEPSQLYRAAISEDNATHEIIQDIDGKIDRLKKAPLVKNKNEL